MLLDHSVVFATLCQQHKMGESHWDMSDVPTFLVLFVLIVAGHQQHEAN